VEILKLMSVHARTRTHTSTVGLGATKLETLKGSENPAPAKYSRITVWYLAAVV
jgi:hypothetical protein